MKNKKLLKKTKLKLLPDEYIIISIPLKQFGKLDLKKIQKKFFSIIYEKDEITLIITKTNWDKIEPNFKNYKSKRNYRILTLDVNLNWNIVGYLYVISKVLADNNIAIGVISTYLKDSLLIKDKDVKKTLKLLKKLKNEK